jgi:hypothetical protein
LTVRLGQRSWLTFPKRSARTERRFAFVSLFRPPVENLIAAKLIRAEAKDLGDIQFLPGRHRPDLSRIRRIVAGFNPRARERAAENLVCLEVLKP